MHSLPIVQLATASNKSLAVASNTVDSSYYSLSPDAAPAVPAALRTAIVIANSDNQPPNEDTNLVKFLTDEFSDEFENLHELCHYTINLHSLTREGHQLPRRF
ncbi:unnamed protein product [Didymodactylos carnosus]|uniref:Uncharacterized protein n=1 Tax=Didymodactylos carnosus TaxID=1234261 RepID=A0A814MQW0_9BILA|nr:unnamed protein product [Didymodactylos carnosus]CAF3848947.1 unnamed protein product [Didymodactylos carnosus]